MSCSVEGCAEFTKARGLCSKHYRRLLSHGDPHITLKPNYGLGRRPRKDGYIDVYEPSHPLARRDGYLMEHRKVAWDAGLLTDPELHVHHINHDKTDNRLENLRPMSVVDHAHEHLGEEIKNQYGTWKRRKSLR